MADKRAAARDDEARCPVKIAGRPKMLCWRGRYALEGTWRRFREEQAFLRDLAAKKPTHTICDECFRDLRERGLSH